jgi:hypothetical protein
MVVREHLLSAGVIAVELGPRVADLDRTAVVLVVAVELTAIAVEAADRAPSSPVLAATQLPP